MAPNQIAATGLQKVMVSKVQAGGDDRRAVRPEVTADADGALLIKVGQGDRAALEQLYHHQGPSLLALLTRLLDDHQMVEEVVQDTFLAVWNGANRRLV